uniref:Zinc finger C3HC4 RING-type domain-containing protein n=1 Tax=Panagrolaimus sp. PS1159 TaxID=55785 RepID=A0AC35EUI3_9BILA
MLDYLACGHSFCNTCLSLCTLTVLCTHVLCPAVRSMDIVDVKADAPIDLDLMDEQDAENDDAEKHHNRISLAAQLP